MLKTIGEAFKEGTLKIGDKVTYLGEIYTVLTYSKFIQIPRVHAVRGDVLNPDGWISSAALVDVPTIVEGSISATKLDVGKPDGGPSAYYDFPFKEWTTVNDMVEYLSDKQWGKHSWIFKDILKAVTRWGSKDGTTFEYDAKKIIYYGARLLMSVSGKETLRKYLQQLLDDKQFQ